LKFDSEKILANVILGDKIKDLYQVSGWSLIRLVTSEGNFDYEFKIDLEFDEVPF
jgi:hypothetical protein